jgi:hypothetical protein
MKTSVRWIALLVLSVVTTLEVSSQCEPDTVNCVDTGLPGQICPRYLPQATVNVPYDEVITVIGPSSFAVNQDTIEIAYVIVDSVKNLPPGINYWANGVKFYPETAYCIQVYGTPVVAGDFALSIFVSAYVYVALLQDTIKVGQFADDTSVVVTVAGPSGIDPFRVDDFQVLPTVPNPFSEITRIGFYTPFDDRIGLKVYNILGELMHEETQGAPPGEHYFQFNGSELLPGTYFYRVTNSSQFYTGKFIKSR